jgi:hypothetical protein
MALAREATIGVRQSVQVWTALRDVPNRRIQSVASDVVDECGNVELSIGHAAAVVEDW